MNILYYPTLWGRNTSAPIRDIVSCKVIPILDICVIKLRQAPSLFYAPYLVNEGEFNKVIATGLKHNSPELFVAAAFRGAVEESQQCGCMICGSIFSPDRISYWRSEAGGSESDWDIAACPICKKDAGVVCDDGEIELTSAILDKLNADALDELKPAEAEERKALMNQVREDLKRRGPWA